MKGNKFKILSVFIAFLLVVFSCEKTPIEKANEDYDWDKVIPMILGKSGNTSVMRTYTYEYRVSPRGGSTFTWNIIGDATLVPDDEVTYKTEVFFPTFNDDEKVVITVFETTHGGVVSAVDTFKATVTDFKCKPIQGDDEITIYEGEPNEATYSVAHRDGSTYAWSTTGGTIAPTSNDWEIDLQVTSADVWETITLTCNETHLGSLNDVAATYGVLISEFCALTNGLDDMVGSWSGTDAWYPDVYTAGIITTVKEDETHLTVSGVSEGLITEWWGEPVIEGGTFVMTVNLEDGTINIPRQYIYTTTYEGNPYDYEIKGKGVWENCGASPTMVLEYDIYYPEDETGLAADYYPDYLPEPFMTADIVLDNAKSKSGQITGNLKKPAFKK